MAISNKTRKYLWGKSGNRCAICRVELFSEKIGGSALNIGEECHIISSKPKGPRYKTNVGSYDIYENLILLCRNHHKEVDELSETFSEEILRYIKAKHEKWVSETLNNSVNSKKNKPRLLNRITSGKELFNIVSEAHGYRTDYEESNNDKDAQFMASVIQRIVDYGELADMVEVSDKVIMARELTKLINELDEHGFFIYGERRIEKVRFASGTSNTWPIATIVVRKKNDNDNDALRVIVK